MSPSLTGPPSISTSLSSPAAIAGPDSVAPGGSGNFVSTLGTELRAGGYLGGAFGALARDGQFLAAFGTEFGAVRFRAAFRTDQLAFAFHVHFLPLLDALQRGFFAGGIHFPGRAGGLNLHLGVGRALAAQPLVFVPAGIADELHATRAAMEMDLGLLDGRDECRIMGLAEAGLRQSLGGGTGLAQHAPEHPGGTTEPARRLSAAERRELRAPRVIAALAVEFELEAGIRSRMHGMVGEVFTEFNFTHDRTW